MIFAFFWWSAVPIYIVYPDMWLSNVLQLFAPLQTHTSILSPLFLLLFFTVKSVRSPCLWSFKSCHTIQMCLFSHGCASDNSTRLSLVTDLLTTHHTAPECSCCTVSAHKCARVLVVCLCGGCSVEIPAMKCPWHLSDKCRSSYNYIFAR